VVEQLLPMELEVTPPLSLLPLTLKVALPPSLEVTQSLLPLDVVPAPSLGVPIHIVELIPCLLPQHINHHICAIVSLD
jgi:hypothetical protein